jgi:hypothetical protein
MLGSEVIWRQIIRRGAYLPTCRADGKNRSGLMLRRTSIASFIPPLAIARLLDDVHVLATLARRLEPEIEEILKTLSILAHNIDPATAKLDRLNDHIADAIPLVDDLNQHLEKAVPLIARLEPLVRDALSLTGPLDIAVDQLGRIRDRLPRRRQGDK